MTKKYDHEFKIADDAECYVGNTHLNINSEKVILDGKPISEWLNTAIAKKVAQLETESLGDESMDTADNKYITIGNKKHSNITVTDEDGNVVATITSNKFAIMEQTPGRITITLKQPNTIKKPKVRAQNITALDNTGLFIKPSGSISNAKLMIDGKPLEAIINDLREAIKSIGVQVLALQASEAADRAYHYKDSGEDHDEHK